MQLLYVGVVVALTLVCGAAGQSNIRERIKETNNHIKLGINSYFDLHKKLQNKVLPGSDNTIRSKLDEMYKLIKCIIELDHNMTAAIEQMQGNKVPDDVIADWITKWLQVLFEKTAALADIAVTIKKNNNEELVKEFDKLNAECLDATTDGLIGTLELVVEEIEAAAARPIATVPRWQAPIPVICEKIRSMLDLCKQMRQAWRKLRLQLKHKELTFEKYPYNEMGLMCDCILEFCKILRQQLRLCKEAQSSTMTADELEKRLCQLIMDLVDIRAKLIDYYYNLIARVSKLVNQHLRRKDRKKSKELVSKAFFQLIQDMDTFIRKLQCFYQDLVEMGGPKLAPIKITTDVNAAELANSGD